MVAQKDPNTPFIWTQAQIDQMNKWCADTTNTLTSMLAQLRIFHDQLYGQNAHDSSPQCPICRDRVVRKEKAEADIIRQRLDKERDASTSNKRKTAI